MSDDVVVIESPTVEKPGAFVSGAFFGGLLAASGVVGVVFQMGGVEPLSWKMLGLSCLFVLFGFIAFACLFTGRRTIVDSKAGRVRVRATAVGVSLPFLVRDVALDDITEVSLNLALPAEDFSTSAGLPSMYRESFADDRYTIVVEMGMKQVEVELSDDYPAARRRAEKLAAAIGVVLVDTATDEAIHTAPDELRA